MALTICILTTDAQIAGAFPLMKQLRDRLTTPEAFVSEVRAQQAVGYVLVGGYDEQNRPLVLAGLRSAQTLARGPHLFVDDLVTHESARGNGYGREMLRWIARYAREHDLAHVYLDSRDTARGFYGQVGFTFGTSIPCWIEASQLSR